MVGKGDVGNRFRVCLCLDNVRDEYFELMGKWMNDRKQVGEEAFARRSREVGGESHQQMEHEQQTFCTQGHQIDLVERMTLQIR